MPLINYGIFLEAILKNLNNFVKSPNFELLKLLLEVLLDGFVEVTESLPEFGVEVVLDAIIVPA